MADRLDSGVSYRINIPGADSSGGHKVPCRLCAVSEAVARTVGFSIPNAVRSTHVADVDCDRSGDDLDVKDRRPYFRPLVRDANHQTHSA